MLQRYDLSADYIRGFADRSSSLSENAISLSGTDDRLLRQVGRSLSLIGVRNTVRVDPKGRTVVRVGGLRGLLAWQKFIGFTSDTKAERLGRMIKKESAP